MVSENYQVTVDPVLSECALYMIVLHVIAPINMNCFEHEFVDPNSHQLALVA